MRLRLAPLSALAIALCAVVAPTQSGGNLRFSGRAALLDVVEALVVLGPPSAPLALVLSPETGRFEVPGFATACFAVVPGSTAVDMRLNSSGSARLRFTVPDAPALIGSYLAAQGIALAPHLATTNCASFAIIAAAVGPDLVETFDDRDHRDARAGAAPWAADPVGVARPGRLGGGGRLGSFDPATGTAGAGGVRVFRSDGHDFPGTHTLSGVTERVDDGVFEFLDFSVPAGVTVRFEGSLPARILVAGSVRIDGVLDAGGVDLEPLAIGSARLSGLPGGVPGPGGGAGGAGGDRPELVGGAVDGRTGEAARVPLGSRRFGPPDGTGGVGSLAWPLAADPLAVRWRFFGFYSNQMAGGGGGGGLLLGGGVGSIERERSPGGDVGPFGPGGLALPQLVVAPSARRDLLVGGAGGGGAGVHPYDSVHPGARFVPGAGGAGGGGALLIACGGDLTIGAAGWIRADGGAAAARDDSHGELAAPGGGGSGGSIVLQVAGNLRNDGLVSARGGHGGSTADLRATPGTIVHGGDGAAGLIAVELAVPAPLAGLGVFDPAVGAAGLLRDEDLATVATSAWIRLPAGGTPTALRYELYTVQDGLPVLYSDVGLGGPAQAGSSPVTVHTRFGQVDGAGRLVPGSEGDWRLGAAVAPAGSNAVRFALRFDRGVPLAPRDLRVEAVRLRF
ncbi:MAG: hypothetical protein IPM29_07855 [Planctomycetes bacterium]|nr:hypothetical protein [Planctomycetota bacterium]